MDRVNKKPTGFLIVWIFGPYFWQSISMVEIKYQIGSLISLVFLLHTPDSASCLDDIFFRVSLVQGGRAPMIGGPMDIWGPFKCPYK